MSRPLPCVRLALCLPLALASLAGCGQAFPDRVQFELTPSRVSACDLPVATTVEWDARALRLESVRIEIHNVGRPPKLWVKEGPKGRAEAGAWAQDGYTVLLKTEDGKVLARRTLTTDVCPEADWL